MPEFSSVSGGPIRTAGAVAGTSSLATTITAGGSQDVKGSWTQLVAATTYSANWAYVSITGGDTLGNQWLVDIGVGAGGSEQIIIPDIYFLARDVNGSFGAYLFPILIPAGVRLAARCQSITGSSTLRVAVTLVSGVLLNGGAGPSAVAAYGASAFSRGINVDPGGTANTDSSWVQITAATTRAHNWLVIAGIFGDFGTAGPNFRLQIGIGAAAAEQVLVPDLHFSADATSDLPTNSVVCLPCVIPTGSRLSAKLRTSVTTAGDRAAYIMLYGAG